MFLLGNFDGFFESVVHPNLSDDYHERQTDRPRIFGCVVSIVVNEVGGRKAKVNEVNKVGGSERSTS